jgi:hypothetical protein
MKVYGQMQGKAKSQQRYQERKDANIAIPPVEKGEQHGSCERHKGHQRQNVLLEEVHCPTPRQTMYAITIAAPDAIHPA